MKLFKTFVAALTVPFVLGVAASAFAQSASDRGNNPPGEPGNTHGNADPGGVETPGNDEKGKKERKGGSPAGNLG